MMTSYSTDEVKVKQVLHFHPSIPVNLKLWMMNSKMLEKASVQFLLLFVLEYTLSPAQPYSCIRAQIPKVVALCLFSAYKTLNPIAFNQHRREQRNRVADWAQREDVVGSRLSFLKFWITAPSVSTIHKGKSTPVMVGSKTVLEPGLAYAYQLVMPVLTGYLANVLQRYFSALI